MADNECTTFGGSVESIESVESMSTDEWKKIAKREVVIAEYFWLPEAVYTAWACGDIAEINAEIERNWYRATGADLTTLEHLHNQPSGESVYYVHRDYYKPVTPVRLGLDNHFWQPYWLINAIVAKKTINDTLGLLGFMLCGPEFKGLMVDGCYHVSTPLLIPGMVVFRREVRAPLPYGDRRAAIVDLEAKGLDSKVIKTIGEDFWALP